METSSEENGEGNKVGCLFRTQREVFCYPVSRSTHGRYIRRGSIVLLLSMEQYLSSFSETSRLIYVFDLLSKEVVWFVLADFYASFKEI